MSGITLAARTSPNDPLYDATDATSGRGDTGSVLISPYINPGSVSTTFYNHYSWLRTMEDLFKVKASSPGIDKKGHIGYAAQPGLAPFGPDVFNNPQGPPKGAGGRVLHASRAHPALSIQGEGISVALAGASVLATAAGPSVPEEGRTPVPETSPCTFIVTFAHATGAIPLSAKAFKFVDEQGHVRYSHVTHERRGAAQIGRSGPYRLADDQRRPADRRWRVDLGASRRTADRLLGLRRRDRLIPTPMSHSRSPGVPRKPTIRSGV